MKTYKNITIQEADVMHQLGIPFQLRCIEGSYKWNWCRYESDIPPTEDLLLHVREEAGAAAEVFEYRVEVE